MERVSDRAAFKDNAFHLLRCSTALGAVLLAGCSSSERSTGTVETQTRVVDERPVLTFDDLGGGSPIIQVYPGPTESPADKIHNGTFTDGNSVPADCKTDGRTVHSDPSAGEEDRTSDQWIRIDGVPGETQYATAVYIENPEALLEQLTECS